MPTRPVFQIAVFEGDGIGPEITPPTIELLKRCVRRIGGFDLSFEHLTAGAKAYLDTGVALPPASIESASQADAILLAAMGDPSIRYPDGTELVPQIELRFALGLYAGIRPIRSIPGVRGPLADPRGRTLDCVLIRESIEGLFAPSQPGTRTDVEATETLLITRANSEKLFHAAFRLARRRQATGHSGRVTCIDKANVFGAFAFFRDIFYEIARQDVYAGLTADHAYVDAMAMNLVNRPWHYDVMVTENMFGDILSDLGAALMGGMGYAPSADIGDEHAVFQPCHGSAPDIAGRGIANPTAMFLSAAMMLDWLADRYQCDAARNGARLLEQAVNQAFLAGTLKTCELGGDSGLSDVTDAVMRELDNINLR